jgi:hypothetical protein
MPAFDRSFSPPAPVADVVVAHHVSSVNSGTLRGKLDTPADMTVIPQELAARLSLRPQARIWAKAFDGTYSRRAVFYIQLGLEGHSLSTVRCIAADRHNVLVG